MNDLPAGPDPAPDAAAPADETTPEPRSETLPDEPTPARPPGGGDVRGQNRVAALGMAALLVALAFGSGFATGRATAPGGSANAPGGSAAASLAPVAGGSPAAPSPTADLPSDGPRLGTADAPVTITYWADYQCPFCAKFAREVIPQLASRIADGTVALVHRDYAFIGAESVDAAIAVRCAGRQGDYWPMHDAVYAAQQGENQGAFARTRLLQVAASVGVDATTFTACLDDHAALVDVLADTAAAVRAGVESTPTIDVNGHRFLGVPDLPRFMATVDAAAAGASPAALPTAKPSPDDWTALPVDGRTVGKATAPVTVELWMDYQSTASSAVQADLEPELRARVTSGKIRLVLRDLALLGDESVTAAAAVRCTDAQHGPAWFVQDVLAVSTQGAGKGVFVPDTLLRFVARLGLDVKAFDTCLGDASITAAVKAETAAGVADGLTAGPAVIVRAGDREVGRFSAPLDVAKIVAAIDAVR